MAISIDISATILNVAGVPVPDKYQGRTLIPILYNKTPDNWRTDFYCEHHMNNKLIPKWYGVRGSQYTYANYYEEKFEFLYDLKNDPLQIRNLAEDPEYSKILKKMQKRSKEYVDKYTRPEIVKLKEEFAKKKPKNRKKKKSRKK